MSIFRNDSLSSLMSRMFTFNKDENGVVYIADNMNFVISKEDAKQLIIGLNKFIEVADETKINEHNNSLLK